LPFGQKQWAGRNPAAGPFFGTWYRGGGAMRQIYVAIFIAVLGCLFSLGCGASTGKDMYKDKDKPKPAEKEN
jgi:hypothetical protein